MTDNITYILCNIPTPAKGENLYLIFVGIIYLLMAIVTALTNLLVQFVFIVKQKRYKNSSDVLLILLGVTDLLAAFLVHPVIAYRLIIWSRPSCDLIEYRSFMTIVLTTLSLSVIAALAYDMHYKITKPFADKSPTTAIILTLITIWSIAITLAVTFVYVIPSLFVVYIGVVSPFCVGIYVAVCIARYKINKEITKMIEKRNTRTSSDIKAIQKTSRMSQSVIIAFGCCYAPPILLGVCVVIFKNTPFIDMYIRPWVLMVHYMNPLLDPIIYCLRMKSVRKEVFKTLRHPCRRVVVENNP